MGAGVPQTIGAGSSKGTGRRGKYIGKQRGTTGKSVTQMAVVVNFSRQ